MTDPKPIFAIIAFLFVLLGILMMSFLTPWHSNMKCHYCGRTLSKTKVKHLAIDRIIEKEDNRILEKTYHKWNCPYCGKQNNRLNEYQD